MHSSDACNLDFRRVYCARPSGVHSLTQGDSNTQVLVMDDGNVGEFGSPDELMAKPEGAFRGMVLEAGLAGSFDDLE